MVKSLERAIDLLEIIYLHGGKMTLAQITKLVDSNKSTVYRALNTFVRKQILNKDPITAEYSLPNKTFQLNLITDNNLGIYQYGKVAMAELSCTYHAPVNLSILDIQTNPLEVNQDGGKFVRTIEQFKEQVHTSTLLTMDQCQKSTVFQPAVYLCFIAFGDVEVGSNQYLENYFKLNQRRLKPKRVYDEFQTEITTVKKQGYAFCQEEYELGYCCLALPIVNEEKIIIASLSISLSQNQFSQLSFEKLLNQMVKVAKSISFQWRLDESKKPSPLITNR